MGTMGIQDKIQLAHITNDRWEVGVDWYSRSKGD